MEWYTTAGTKISKDIPGRAKSVKEQHNASMYPHSIRLLRQFHSFRAVGVFDYSVIGVFRDCCISFIPESAAHVEAVHM